MNATGKCAIAIILLLSAALGPLSTTFAQEVGPPEFRGLWVDTWGSPGPYDAESTTTLVDTAFNAGYNAIVFEVRKCGDAYYNSAYEPWARNIVVTDPPYDPLADMLEKAHAKGMEVHAWVIPYRIWNKNWPAAPDNHVFVTHPEWRHVTHYGNDLVGTYYELDPGVPFVQEYICSVIKDFVGKYDVDGVNFDRIRYPESSYWGSGYTVNPWGYNQITRERFRREYGAYPPTKSTSPLWPTWCDFRRAQITDLVRKCYAECIYLKPKVKMSADTIAWMGGDPNTDFTKTQAYSVVFQDHKGWMEQHILDMNILMNYKREHDSAQKNDFRLWTTYLANNKYGRHSVNGPAAYLNAISGTVTQVLHSREAGLEGVCTYNYRSTNKDNLPSQQFYDAIKAGPFALSAPLPDMPWKSAPTAGILFGQVTDASMPNDPVYGNWIYKADVTIAGPVSGSFQTDGTGTFVFMDLPPGDYSVTVSSFGFKTAVGAATVTAGLATRLDFALELVDPFSIYEAMKLPDGTQVTLPGNVVTSPTGALEGCIYVESPNRTAGIKVKPLFWTDAVDEGDVVGYVGVLTTENGERVLDQARLLSREPGSPLGALALAMKNVDRAPSPVGLLAQVTGLVTESGDGWFTLCDGSGSLRVLCPGKAKPAASARVSGIIGMAAGDPDPVPVLHVRYQGDIEADPTGEVLTSLPDAVQQGFNLIGVPGAPINPDPAAVFDGLDIAGKLSRWQGGGWAAYDEWSAEDFGGILRGEGYGLDSGLRTDLSCRVASDEGAADMRITLPKAGWNLISQPFATPSKYADMWVTDGEQMLTVRDAVQAGWIMPLLFTWDNAKQRLDHVWLKANGKGQYEWAMPWQGYWARTHKDDLALVIPRSEWIDSSGARGR